MDVLFDRILLVREKFADANPECGLSHGQYMYRNTLDATGAADEIRHFYYDVLLREVGQDAMTDRLIEECATWKPDLVLYTPMPKEFAPHLAAFVTICNGMGVPVWFIVTDTLGDYPTPADVDAATGMIFQDAAPLPELQATGKCFAGWFPMDEETFYYDGRQRLTDVSFLGTCWQNTPRAEWLERLRAEGIEVKTGGGQHVTLGGRPVAMEEYADVLRDSRIVLNTAWFKDHARPHTKTRVWEATACGALVLEEDNLSTRRFFNDDEVAYYARGDFDDMLAKCRYYLIHDEERARAATAGRLKRRRGWDYRSYWQMVFGRVLGRVVTL